MLPLRLDPESPLPLVDQIVGGVRQHIEDRLLRPGMRLPPIRGLADEHHISRFTVVEAYDRLVALGYLQSRRGSGFYVAPRPTASLREHRPGEVERAFDNAGVLYQSLEESGDRLKVGVGWLPPEWLDEEGLRRNIRLLARRADTRVAGYGTAQGYAPLREQISLRLAELGIAAPASQITLTHGATQALDIVARTFLCAGDCVLVDDPGYWNLFANLRLYGVQLVGVPRTASGPDPEALAELLQTHRPKAFFTHSVLHNPTSGSLAPANAFRVLQLAEQHDFLIVEDDTYGDLHPGAATRLAQLDLLRRTIYIGSFSKTLSGCLRVGFFAAAPALMARLTDVKIVSCVSTSEFSERLVYQMLTEGPYRKFVDRVQGRLAMVTEQTLRLLERCGMRIDTEPKGGMFVWARTPGISDATPLARRAADAGIMLAPGSIFRPQTQPSPWIRFNVAYATDPRLERFLGEALGR
ncbi:PLP-dependent aminotransferase family protein [Rhodocyclus gracilis]|uniref:Aminotransferase class I/II-fold pyridoxal phosphate-dependent enzyme n=1 Tax=Rhodocyclus tenuis TaxID=1066 RepID=A0A6L5JY09_RHOTE|nr:PLP-dependent aminotransferase family protein [Rhodocyclus gracilis]MQY51534.1 aminotransferase class I/II-fold pyridoxal phosphate-dependent enzyme [Rhodocyclus gracilis]